jgi:hypothetical protein
MISAKISAHPKVTGSQQPNSIINEGNKNPKVSRQEGPRSSISGNNSEPKLPG